MATGLIPEYALQITNWYAAPGTRTVVHQAAAPLGWTQDTTLSDYTIQLVGGAGGSTAGSNGYSTMFQNTWTSDGHALSVAELAVHNHTDAGHNHGITDNGHNHNYLDNNSANCQVPTTNAGTQIFVASGGNNSVLGSHTATVTTGISNQASTANIQNTGSGSAHSHTKTFNCLCAQMIVVQKS